MAFCKARKLEATPASFENLGGYFTDYFLRGNTTRTFSTIATRLHWFYRSVLDEPWLSQSSPSEHRRFIALRRALSKLDDSPVKKARPLYARILQMIAGAIRPGNLQELQVLACFTLAHAAIQRLGELLDGKATLRNLRCYKSPAGPFFAFFYYLGNKPKNFKIGQTPFAMISRKANPFAFHVIDTYLRRQFGEFGVTGGVTHVTNNTNSLPIAAPRGVNLDTFLFPQLNGSRSSALSKATAVSVLRTLLRRVKVPCPEEYSGHSARRGGYVDRMHVPLRYVQIQGHWAPGSATTDQDYSVHNIQLRQSYF